MQMALAVGLAAAISGVAATLTAEQSAQTVQLRDDCDRPRSTPIRRPAPASGSSAEGTATPRSVISSRT
jgi:hypothetical protein